ncbi:Microtubule-associated tumor suppressor candidate 2-like protein [Sciurus carolinensis]|uniref:Microtubule-associated tumor suppressor candidate 2-like protein n=1 Tax=Sciurus carolinensis TaxID=30640 RepID=A0AA41TBI1_SCICA|nr:Microtubule-associated tumor suppressor candidate 2-like protein [Sciurus carolinensis]
MGNLNLKTKGGGDPTAGEVNEREKVENSANQRKGTQDASLHLLRMFSTQFWRMRWIDIDRYNKGNFNYTVQQRRSQAPIGVEDITASHEAALLEMENNHTVAIAILQDDHDHKVQELMTTHELEKKELEENFEKLRLSLQIALAPYQHLEEDMKSLKQVLEMKNQQIHQQEKKIIELEKLVKKNIILEEKIQVLQQQNEDLKARIDQNTVVTRQLSEENANLQEYVEKETQEKKRLSRTNEELLWKLQTGDPTSPIKLSPTSPVYRGSSSGPSSPARVSTTPR